MDAPEAFEAIASNSRTFHEFHACIGDASAHSRLIAAQRAALHPTVLDLGCGPAVWWATLVRLGSPPVYTGADASPAMLARARALWPELDNEHRLVLLDPKARLPFMASHFSFVHVRHLLEHLPLQEAVTMLVEAFRIAHREVVFTLSQFSHTLGSSSILTDGHLGAQRWSHPRATLEVVIREAGFHLIERQRTRTVREELWICCRVTP